MAISFVQNKQVSGGATTSLTITLDAPLTQNNLVVVHIKIATHTSALSSVTDNASTPNTYDRAIGPINGLDGSGNRHYQYYGVQVVGGATAITVTWVTSNGARITVDEFSGTATSNAAVFDVATSNTGLAATSSSVTLSPTAAGELISASVVGGSSPVAGANYTMAVTNINQSTLYRLSGTTSETAPVTWTGTANWTEVAAAYKALGIATQPSKLALLGMG